jgi:hypothetical protein
MELDGGFDAASVCRVVIALVATFVVGIVAQESPALKFEVASIKQACFPSEAYFRGFSAAGTCNLQERARIPIASGSNINYENIGTSIDCSVYTKRQGLFRTEISLEDSSVYIAEPQNGTAQAASPAAGRPVFRSR